VVLALWQIISVTGIVSQQKLPSLTTLWSTAVRLITTTSPTYGTLQGAMAISLERVAIGFAIGGGIPARGDLTDTVRADGRHLPADLPRPPDAQPGHRGPGGRAAPVR